MSFSQGFITGHGSRLERKEEALKRRDAQKKLEEERLRYNHKLQIMGYRPDDNGNLSVIPGSPLEMELNQQKQAYEDAQNLAKARQDQIAAWAQHKMKLEIADKIKNGATAQEINKILEITGSKDAFHSMFGARNFVDYNENSKEFAQALEAANQYDPNKGATSDGLESQTENSNPDDFLFFQDEKGRIQALSLNQLGPFLGTDLQKINSLAKVPITGETPIIDYETQQAAAAREEEKYALEAALKLQENNRENAKDAREDRETVLAEKEAAYKYSEEMLAIETKINKLQLKAEKAKTEEAKQRYLKELQTERHKLELLLAKQKQEKGDRINNFFSFKDGLPKSSNGTPVFNYQEALKGMKMLVGSDEIYKKNFEKIKSSNTEAESVYHLVSKIKYDEGMGHFDSAADWVDRIFSQDPQTGGEFRSALSSFVNRNLKEISGAQVTDKERAIVFKEYGVTITNSEAQFLQAFSGAIDMMRTRFKNSFPELEDEPGIKEQLINPIVKRYEEAYKLAKKKIAQHRKSEDEQNQAKQAKKEEEVAKMFNEAFLGL